MKKIIALLLICLAGIDFALSQQTYTSFTSGYGGSLKESHDIQIGKEGKLYVDLISADRISKQAGIILSRKRIPGFITCLDSALKKYESWREIAIKNGIKEMSKGIPCDCRAEGYFTYGDWQFDFSVFPTFEFKVLESEGKVFHLMIMRTGEMQSSTNQFMNHDGGLLIFENSEDFREFINLIKPETVDAFLAKQPKTEELFK